MPENANPGSSNGQDRTVKSIEVLFSILEFIKENDGAGVTETAEAVDMSKGAVHRYLATLVKAGYATKSDGEYKLGLRFLDLGTYTRTQYDLGGIELKVEQLAQQTNERAQFIIAEHGQGIYLHRERGKNAVETDARVGKIVHLHTIAAGKAILAYLERERIEEIIDQHGLVDRTTETITSRERLYDILDETRERGYALNRNEHVEGLCGVGVPVKGVDGEVIGGLSVSGPTNRLQERLENGDVPNQLLGSVNEIELNLRYK